MQEVLFAGFAKNEPVTVTLYSAPQPLPATRADHDGVVLVDFTVPANLEPATHLLRVVGQVSKVTGIASFVVTAPVVSSSAVVVPSTPVSTSAAPSSTPVSSAPVSSAVLVPVTPSAVSSVASTTAVSSATGAVVPAAGSGRAVWPWYALGALLVLLAGVVAYLLVRRSRLAAERRENDALLADAAAAEHERNLDAIARANAEAPTAYLGGAGPGGPPPAPGGYTGYHPGEHGLLSGRDNPDNPGLLSGTGYRALPPVEPPTTYLPDERTTQLPDGRTTQLPDERTTQLPDGRTTQSPGERTTQLPGDGATTRLPDERTRPAAQPPADPPADDATAGGPATGTWRPDFDDEADGGDDPDGPASGGRHSRPS